MAVAFYEHARRQGDARVDDPRRRDREAAREHVPPRQHRARERAGDRCATRWGSTCGRSSTRRRTKPFGFMPFFPGPGIGGHCIPLDPTYLAWQIRRESGPRFGVLEQAQDVNERMPNWVASRVGGDPERPGAVGERAPHPRARRVVQGRRRRRPRVTRAAHDAAAPPARSATCSFHDFYVDEVPLQRRDDRRACRISTPSSRTADVVVLLTPHTALRPRADRCEVPASCSTPATPSAADAASNVVPLVETARLRTALTAAPAPPTPRRSRPPSGSPRSTSRSRPPRAASAAPSRPPRTRPPRAPTPSRARP